MMKQFIRIFHRIYDVLCNIIIIDNDKKFIRSLKGKDTGKRCFVVGNGPSLSVEDLEKIKGEIAFGTHRIYEIFDKTSWRPDYYLAQDYKLICVSRERIENIEVKNKLIAIPGRMPIIKIKGAKYIKLFFEEFYPQLPQFAENIENGIYEGYTVTYMCLQVAAYMGFKEIYLLGVDHSYSTELDENGNLLKNENVRDHFSDNDKIENVPQTFKSALAYKAAKEYAEKHGIKIYNATRGGKLEVFERKTLEEVLGIE